MRDEYVVNIGVEIVRRVQRVHYFLVHRLQVSLRCSSFLNFSRTLLVVVNGGHKNILIALHQWRDEFSADGRYEQVTLMDLHPVISCILVVTVLLSSLPHRIRLLHP